MDQLHGSKALLQDWAVNSKEIKPRITVIIGHQILMPRDFVFQRDMAHRCSQHMVRYDV